MPSRLGAQIRAARLGKSMKLRELARAIGKSPAFITRLECEDEFPSASPDTLKAIAEVLGLEADALLVGAGRAREVEPKTELELALYRKVQGLKKKDQEALLKRLNRNPRGPA